MNKIKLRKLFVGCALTLAIVLSNSRIDNNLALRKEIVSANASGSWKKSDDGNLYYIDSSGAMQTGWLHLEKKTYYLFSSGEMAIGVTVIGKIEYFFDGDGEFKTEYDIYEKE
ncbi:hypothetical protein [uncultured Parvimonas sp.]|uniref:hypothetical protein n=1 Tax=uncultured Parvimonas sp. TaxID=747372 RepID=UPI002591B484|nr:hypothetical protein [uncultured Parvimonas sp.]